MEFLNLADWEVARSQKSLELPSYIYVQELCVPEKNVFDRLQLSSTWTGCI